MVQGKGHGKLERPHIRVRLIQALATGNEGQAALAREYEVTQSAIALFKARHIDDIKRIAAGTLDALAILWITQKANRLGLYQSLAADALAELDEVEGCLSNVDSADLSGNAVSELGSARSRARRDAAKMARHVAEEMPDGLPARNQISISGKVEYTINGVDLDDLR